MKTKSRTSAFTLVELLVVIGIIAVLIGILLPALSKARDQANTVKCSATMREFYNCWQMYATLSKGRVLPARHQAWTPTGDAAEFGFYEAAFLGQVLRNNRSTGTNDGRGIDTAMIIKKVLTCAAAYHDNDPDADSAAAVAMRAVYFGDYIYNSWMGTLKRGAGPTDPYIVERVNPKVASIPGNVIILMESRKPNVSILPDGNFAVIAGLPGNGYKYYFEKNTEIWTTDVSSGQPASNLVKLRIGTPHQRGKKMHVLCADGRISLVDPAKDFFTDPNNQATVKDYLWNARTNDHTGWRKGAPGI
jgi:prepilin-type N-terminal cleavage/methylation domain-containing protein